MAEVLTLFPDEPERPPRAEPDVSLFPEDTTSERLRSSVEKAHDKPPELASRVLRLQQRTGLPEDLIERNVDEIERKASAQDFDAETFRKTSPKLAQWMADNPNNAAIAKDDVRGMTLLEEAYTAITEIPAGLEMGVNKQKLMFLNYSKVVGGLSEEREAERLGLKKLNEASSKRFQTGLPSWTRSGADIFGMNLYSLTESMKRGGAIGAAGGAGTGAALGLIGGPTAPATVLLGASIGGVKGLVAGTSAEYMINLYKSVVGEAYDDLEDVKDADGNPLDPTVVRYASMILGIPNAALETLSLGKVLKIIPGAERLLGKMTTQQMRRILVKPSVLAALKDFGGKYAVAVGTETFTEGMQKFLNIVGREIAQEFTDQPFAAYDEGQFQQDVRAVAAEAAMAFKGMVTLGALGAGPKVYTTVTEMQEASKNERLFEALANVANETKTPEGVAAFTGALKESGGPKNVYIPVERFDALFQEAAPQAAQELLGSLDQYTEAKALGADLVIPIEVYAEKMAGSKFHVELVGDMRLAPGQMTLRERDLALANLDEDQRADLEAQETTFRENQPLRDIYRDVYGQLLQTGMDRSSAERNAMMWMERYRARAERLGVDPMSLYQERPIRVRRDLPAILSGRPEVDIQVDPLLDELRTGRTATTQEDIYGKSLMTFLREKGGVQDQGGELSAKDIDAGKKAGLKGNFIQAGGLTHDMAAEAAAAEGYIEGHDINQLLDAIDAESRGAPVYAAGKENQQLQDRERSLAELGEYLESIGVDLAATDNATVRRLMREAAMEPGEGIIDQGQVPRELEVSEGGVAYYNVQDESLYQDLPTAPRGPETAGAESAPRARNIRSAVAIRHLQTLDDAPGLYAVETALVTERTRTLPVNRVTNAQEAAQALAFLTDYTVEHFDALVTNASGRPLAIIGSFKGAGTQASVYPSTLLHEAVRIKGAAYVWMAHNHPSGTPRLSQADLGLHLGLHRVFENTGIKSRGLFAIAGRENVKGWQLVTRDPGDAREWGATTITDGTVARAAEGVVKIPVVERVFTKQERLSEAAITSPMTAAAVVVQIAKDQTGLVLMDAQNTPVGFYPMTLEQIGAVDRAPVKAELSRAISQSNAMAVIVASPGGQISQPLATSLRENLRAQDVKVLDAISYRLEGNKAKDIVSYAEKGLMEPPAAYGEQELFQPAEDWVRQVSGFAAIEKHLTPTERGKLRADTAQRVIDLMNAMPSAREMAAVAQAGIAKRGWYRHSAEALVNVFGSDATRVAALLGAMSPRTSVEQGTLNALNVWKAWIAAGRPTNRRAIIGIMAKNVQGESRGSVLNAWINNTVRALATENLEGLVLSGPKVNSFFNNLIGVTYEVTLDAWMANYALVDQDLFAGALNVAGTDPGKGTGYLAMSVRVRQAAEIASKITGETWTPAEIQETIWSWAKTLYELGSRAGETRSAVELLREGELTDDLIGATKDFRLLFHEPRYQKVLEEAGYGDQVAALTASAGRDEGAGAEVLGAEGEAAKAARSLNPHLLRAARRLDQLRKDRAEAKGQTLYQVAPTIAGVKHWYYSELQLQISSHKQASGTAAQWKGIIKNLKGVKKEELALSGVEEWLDIIDNPLDFTVLDAYPGRKVTREQIVDFLAGNAVRLEEHVLGRGVARQPGTELLDLRTERRRLLIANEDIIIDHNHVAIGRMEAVAQTAYQRNLTQIERIDEEMAEIEGGTGPMQGRYGDIGFEQGTDGQWTIYDGGTPLDETYDSQAIADAAAVDYVRAVTKAVEGSTLYGPDTHPTMSLPGAEGYRELVLTVPPKGEARPHHFDITHNDELLAEGIHSSNVDSEIAAIWTHQGIREEDLEVVPAADTATGREGAYRGGHYEGYDNVVAHIRFDERTDADGKRVLFIEEIQSDWGQKGRQEGFRKILTPDQLKELDRKAAESRLAFIVFVESMLKKYRLGHANGRTALLSAMTFDEEAEYKTVKDRRDLYKAEWDAAAGFSPKTPTGPFVTSTEAWSGLAMKRMIAWAAENGYDRIAWTTGAQQVERYESALRQRVDEIQWEKTEQGVHLRGIKQEMTVVDTRYAETELSDAIGKTMANQIMSDSEQRGVIVGDKIKIDDTGMAGFYDRMLPSTANKIIGKIGGGRVTMVAFSTESQWDTVKRAAAAPTTPDRLEVVRIGPAGPVVSHWVVKNSETGEIVSNDYADDIGAMFHILNSRGWSVTEALMEDGLYEIRGPDGTIAEIENGLRPALTAAVAFSNGELTYTGEPQKTAGGVSEQPGFDITPAMREAVANKLPLFQGPSDKRGSYSPSKNLITLFKRANPSTFLHESGHAWLEELRADAERPDAPQQIVDDWNLIRAWAGIPDLRMGQVIPVEAHEKFARGIEGYVMEGKAPSIQLRNAFARFKDWLVRIYRNLRGLDIELTDETRAVMDRLLATDEAIAQAQENAGYGRQLLGPEGMTQAEFAAYQELNETAKRESEDSVRVQTLKELTREREAWWKEERLRVVEEVADELDGQPVYQALAWFRTGQLPGGRILLGVEHARLSKDALVQNYGEGFLQNLPKPYVYQVKGGLHPDFAAHLFGFETGDQLVKALAESRPRKQLIEAEADVRMRDRHGDMLNDGSLADQANLVVHNDRQVEVFQHELRILQRRGAGRKLSPMSAMKALATEMIGGKRVDDLNAKYFERAAMKAGQDAEQALIAQDFDTAFDAKQRQILGIFLYREALARQEAVESALDGWKKMFRPDARLAKSRNMDMVNAARAIAAQHGIGAPSGSASGFMAQLKQYDPQTYDDLIETVDLVTSDAKPYGQLTLDEFTTMSEAIDGLWALSKTSQQIEVDGRKMERKIAVGELRERLAEFKKPADRRGMKKAVSDREKFTIRLLNARAALRRVESWVTQMDGPDTEGGRYHPFRTYLWQIVSEAADKFRDEKRKVMERLRVVIAPIEKSLTLDKIDAHEIGYLFGNNGSGKAELLGALLHIGNESNLQKLLRGREWGQFLEDGTLDTSRWDAFIKRMQDDGVLTKTDYDFVQGVWNLNESLKPGAQKAHKEILGYYFSEVTAKEFNTPFGRYAGGYVPAVVDPLVSEDAAIRADKETFERKPNSFMFPTTGRGFTKKRHEGYARPLEMDIRLLSRQIDKVLRFTHIEPRTRDVARLVNDPEFRGAMGQIDSQAASRMLVPWLQRTAQQAIEEPSSPTWQWLSGPARWVRRSTGLNIMAANVTNTMQQFTGLGIAATRVKPKHLRNGLFRLIHERSDLSSEIAEKSSFMRNRTATQVMEVEKTIDNIVLNPSKAQKAAEFAREHGYFMQVGTQNIVDLITWSGAYEQATEANLGEKEAIRAADSAVRETQGTFASEDMSAFEAGTPFVRAFTMFYSYFNMQANLLGTEFAKAAEVGGFKGAGRAFYVYVFGFMIPAVMSEAIVQLMSGEAIDDDDDDGYLDNFLSIFLGGQGRTLAALFPFVGPAAMVAVNKFDDKWYNDRISTSPAISMLESAAGAPYSIYKAAFDDGSWKSAIRSTLALVGLATGFPILWASKPLGYLAEIEQGRIEPPTNPLEAGRGLISGRAPR